MENIKSYWLRGGVIVLIIGTVLHLILFSVAIGVHDISNAYGIFVESIFSFFASLLLIEPLSNEGFSYNESLAISSIHMFSIGAFVGWLYGKWKLNSKSSGSLQ